MQAVSATSPRGEKKENRGEKGVKGGVRSGENGFRAPKKGGRAILPSFGDVYWISNANSSSRELTPSFP